MTTADTTTAETGGAGGPAVLDWLGQAKTWIIRGIMIVLALYLTVQSLSVVSLLLLASGLLLVYRLPVVATIPFALAVVGALIVGLALLPELAGPDVAEPNLGTLTVLAFLFLGGYRFVHWSALVVSASLVVGGWALVHLVSGPAFLDFAEFFLGSGLGTFLLVSVSALLGLAVVTTLGTSWRFWDTGEKVFCGLAVGLPLVLLVSLFLFFRAEGKTETYDRVSQDTTLDQVDRGQVAPAAPDGWDPLSQGVALAALLGGALLFLVRYDPGDPRHDRFATVEESVVVDEGRYELSSEDPAESGTTVEADHDRDNALEQLRFEHRRESLLRPNGRFDYRRLQEVGLADDVERFGITEDEVNNEERGDEEEA